MPKTKGAGSYQEIKLAELNKLFQPSANIVVKRKWLEQFATSETKPIQQKQKIEIQDPSV